MELDARTTGKIIRAAKDKAEDEIARSVNHPCTVVQVAMSTKYPGGYAVCHVDGDPAGDVCEIPILNGLQLAAGDRAFIQYGPPWGAVISSSMNGVAIPLGRMSLRCGGGGGGGGGE